MNYKTGDKFIIEIDSVMTNKKGTLYGVKGFKSLVFDEYGLKLLERVDEEEDDELQVGDEIISDDGTKAVVTFAANGMIDAIDAHGATYVWFTNEYEKTGRHFDEVEKLLRKIGE